MLEVGHFDRFIKREAGRVWRAFPSHLYDATDLRQAGAVGALDALRRMRADSAPRAAADLVMSHVRGSIRDEVRSFVHWFGRRDYKHRAWFIPAGLMREHGALAVAPSAEDEYAERDARHKMLAAAWRLPARERRVFDGYARDEMALSAIGRREGITESRASQILADAKRRIIEELRV